MLRKEEADHSLCLLEFEQLLNSSLLDQGRTLGEDEMAVVWALASFTGII